MRRALQVARRGEGRVEPNPMVGCVLARGGQILSEGWHSHFGGPHAEVVALSRCPRSARGATAYVTLEPCDHFGKTPPCARALLEAGVARVVCAMRDPTPIVDGRGLGRLRRAGVRVEVGLEQRAAEALMAPYLKRLRARRPWVILKWAQSLDGRIATHEGDARWISSPAARRDAHRLRARVDAIVVGIGTVLADDPNLTCREVPPRRVATRVVLDRSLRTPLRAQLVRDAGAAPVLIVSGAGADADRAEALRSAGCEVIALGVGPAGEVDALLALLAERGATNVMVEGGGRVLGAFRDAGAADEVRVYLSPLLIGGEQAPAALRGVGAARLIDAQQIEGRLRSIDGGWVLRGRISRAAPAEWPASTRAQVKKRSRPSRAPRR